LGEADVDQRTRHAEFLRDPGQHGAHVFHVVGNGVLAILLGHPARHDGAAACVKAVEPLDADQSERAIPRDVTQHVHVDRRVFLVAMKADERATARFGNIDEVAAMGARSGGSYMHELESLPRRSAKREGGL
jgi:hypothetical protein